jgi:hypothetical protein
MKASELFMTPVPYPNCRDDPKLTCTSKMMAVVPFDEHGKGTIKGLRYSSGHWNT